MKYLGKVGELPPVIRIKPPEPRERSQKPFKKIEDILSEAADHRGGRVGALGASRGGLITDFPFCTPRETSEGLLLPKVTTISHRPTFQYDVLIKRCTDALRKKDNAVVRALHQLSLKLRKEMNKLDRSARVLLSKMENTDDIYDDFEKLEATAGALADLAADYATNSQKLNDDYRTASVEIISFLMAESMESMMAGETIRGAEDLTYYFNTTLIEKQVAWRNVHTNAVVQAEKLAMSYKLEWTRGKALWRQKREKEVSDAFLAKLESWTWIPQKLFDAVAYMRSMEETIYEMHMNTINSILDKRQMLSLTSAHIRLLEDAFHTQNGSLISESDNSINQQLKGAVDEAKNIVKLQKKIMIKDIKNLQRVVNMDSDEARLSGATAGTQISTDTKRTKKKLRVPRRAAQDADTTSPGDGYAVANAKTEEIFKKADEVTADKLKVMNDLFKCITNAFTNTFLNQTAMLEKLLIWRQEVALKVEKLHQRLSVLKTNSRLADVNEDTEAQTRVEEENLERIHNDMNEADSVERLLELKLEAFTCLDRLEEITREAEIATSGSYVRWQKEIVAFFRGDLAEFAPCLGYQLEPTGDDGEKDAQDDEPGANPLATIETINMNRYDSTISLTTKEKSFEEMEAECDWTLPKYVYVETDENMSEPIDGESIPYWPTGERCLILKDPPHVDRRPHKQVVWDFHGKEFRDLKAALHAQWHDSKVLASKTLETNLRLLISRRGKIQTDWYQPRLTWIWGNNALFFKNLSSWAVSWHSRKRAVEQQLDAVDHGREECTSLLASLNDRAPTASLLELRQFSRLARKQREYFASKRLVPWNPRWKHFVKK